MLDTVYSASSGENADVVELFKTAEQFLHDGMPRQEVFDTLSMTPSQQNLFHLLINIIPMETEAKRMREISRNKESDKIMLMSLAIHLAKKRNVGFHHGRTVRTRPSASQSSRETFVGLFFDLDETLIMKNPIEYESQNQNGATVIGRLDAGRLVNGQDMVDLFSTQPILAMLRDFARNPRVRFFLVSRGRNEDLWTILRDLTGIQQTEQAFGVMDKGRWVADALTRHDLTPDRCIFVDDTPRQVQIVLEASPGIQTILADGDFSNLLVQEDDRLMMTGQTTMLSEQNVEAIRDSVTRLLR